MNFDFVGTIIHIWLIKDEDESDLFFQLKCRIMDILTYTYKYINIILSMHIYFQ